MANAVAVIPARYASTRLPGKPLLADTGLPLICHVLEQVGRAERVASALVATDDERIASAVRESGGRAVMTRADHPNGTSRIAEVAAGLPAGIQWIINVQGDEPEIDPRIIDRLVDRLRETGEPMATVAAPFAAGEDAADPNVVKVVLNRASQALYFSRALIPHDRDRDRTGGGAAATPLKHLGIYGYRREFLLEYARMPATPLEQTEKLEQLRVLEHGRSIGVIVAESSHPGIDTAQQYAEFVERWRREHG